MFLFMLCLIYAAFISLGLPDGLLGSAWPVMYQELQVPVSYAGVISMIIAGGTVVSSLQSDRLTLRFGTGWVVVGSVAMSYFAISPSIYFFTVFLLSPTAEPMVL